jgi:hypothetical protein
MTSVTRMPALPTISRPGSVTILQSSAELSFLTVSA